MSREIVISEADKIAVILEDGNVTEFFLNEGEQFVGDIILATVESIVPAIEAAFLDIGREKSGFIHVSDLPASRKQQSGIRQFIKPQQTLLVQVTREPTGNKGACLTGFISLPGRFLVLTPFERRIGLSKRIYDARERARLARIARMICGSGYGIVLRPEAVGQSEQTLREDLKLLLARWKNILAQSEKQQSGTTLYRDQDILERILREGLTNSVNRIVVDSQGTFDRAQKFFNNWSDTNTRSKLRVYNGPAPIMSAYGVYQQLEKAIQPLVQLPSGGTLVIQATEALTSIDVNTSSMTSTDNQPETILRTNCEAAVEIARQLMLRDIGGVIVIDFIDMDNPRDQQIVWQKLADSLQHDKAQPQINYFSDFGLVEMTRRRQRQRLSELMTSPCPTCLGVGRIRNLLYRSDLLTMDGLKTRLSVGLPAEKNVRYRGGVEKPSREEAPPRETREREPREQRAERQAPKETQAPKVREQAPPKHVHVPVEEPVMEKQPELEVAGRKDKLPEPERLEDILFDPSYFSAEITDEVLDEYIEREDNLHIPANLSASLDQLLAQIDEHGLTGIKVTSGAAAKPARDEANDDENDFNVDAESYIESEDEEELPLPEMVEEEAEEQEPEQERPAKPARRGRQSRAAKAAAEEEAKAKEIQEANPLSDDAVEAVQSEHDETVDVVADATQSDEDAAEEANSPVETAVAVSKEKPAKPVKKLLTKRRTIRSFRPKK